MKILNTILHTVLFITEDNQQIKNLQQSLENLSFSCSVAENGKDGIKKFLDIKPDIIFINDILPDMKSDVLIKEIKNQSDKQSLKDKHFILLNSSNKIKFSQLKELGFKTYLEKPYNLNDLSDCINKISNPEILSDNKKIENSVQNGKQFLESILESSVESIFTTDKKGYITYCNKSCTEFLKYNFNEILGLNICELLNDGSSELLQILDIIKVDGKLTNYKTFLKNNDNNKIPVSLFLSPMKDIDGNIIGYLALTMHKNEDIDKSSSQKSEKLTTILETAITVNHAINNPLVPILGQAQFLLQDERIIDEDIRKRLKVIINNALRIKNITQKLTRISKPVSKEYIKGTMMLDLDASI